MDFQYYLDRRFIEKFKARLDLTSVPGCHLWTGALNGPYGQVRTIRPLTMRRAHSVALEIHLKRRLDFGPGARMERLNANHTAACPHKHCCNPEHLYEGTQRQNMHDMIAAGTHPAVNAAASRTTCPRGHPYDMAASNGGRACKVCHQAAMARSGDRKLAGTLRPKMGRPRIITCTHGTEFLVRRKSGAVSCRRCEADRKKELRAARALSHEEAHARDR